MPDNTINIITPNTNLSPGSISEVFIKDAAVTEAKIADGAITSAKIAVDVIVAEDIANNAITVAELQDNAVTTAKILDANVTTAKIADGSITAAKIADGTVVAAELASNSVTTDKILDANVTLAKMAANSVDSDQYVDGSIDTAHIGDDQVTLAKISTSGASNAQVLAYNSTSGAVEWTTDSDIAVGSITDKMKITETASLLSPILHLETDNNGWDKTHILLEDSNDDAVAIVGRNNTTYSRYQQTLVMDPNNTKPRTNVTGNGLTYAGDYLFDFSKNYQNQEYITMDLNVYGANNGFNIISRDDANGGVDSYNYKPISLKGSDIAMRIGTTPFGSTLEKLAFNDTGTSISNGALVHGLDRETSNHQFVYLGTDTTGTPGVPKVKWQMHRRDSSNRLMKILEATDYGSGDSASVDIAGLLWVTPDKVNTTVPLELANLSSAPSSPSRGMMYFNTTDNKFYGYNGSSWVALDTQ